MIHYILKRLLQAIPILIGIATITFFIVHMAPGDPMDMYLNPIKYGGDRLDPEVIQLYRQKYGLDQPLHIQYVKWMEKLIQGDLGESFRYRRPVVDLLKHRFSCT